MNLQKDLHGKTVSVLMEGLKGKEAYVGVVESIDDTWLVLATPGGKYDKIYVRTEAVISILRRTEDYKPH